MKNINITGTFKEYVESIATEIQRLLSDSKNWSAKVEDNFRGTTARVPVKVIFIREGDSGPGTHFSISEEEFFTLQEYAPEKLSKIAAVRFTDAVDSIENLLNESLLVIKKLRS